MKFYIIQMLYYIFFGWFASAYIQLSYDYLFYFSLSRKFFIINHWKEVEASQTYFFSEQRSWTDASIEPTAVNCRQLFPKITKYV